MNAIAEMVGYIIVAIIMLFLLLAFLAGVFVIIAPFIAAGVMFVSRFGGDRPEK